MKKNKVKVVSILLIILTVISIGITADAHSGRTDSNGGHKDNQNKSGLGSYHYHCGGHPAHLHTNGVCPYSSNSSSKSSTPSKSSTSGKSSTSSKSTTSTKSSTPSSQSSSTKTTSATTTEPATVPSKIDVTGIQINEKIESLEVGKSRIISATITPSDATDKSIKWKSSDESIATISETGEITAKKSGIVNITAISSNEKTSTIEVNIQKEELENNNIIETSTTNQNNITTQNVSNITTNNQENSNPLGGILALGLLGGGGYWGYKKYKK